MKSRMLHAVAWPLLAVGLLAFTTAWAGNDKAQANPWRPVANSNDHVPVHDGWRGRFHSFNQPSVNENGMVVFRARGKPGNAGGHGGGHEEGVGGHAPETDEGGHGAGHTRGIYLLDLADRDRVIRRVADAETAVPQPNNTHYPPAWGLATFTEFPSIPRIDRFETVVATRGQSPPVWTVTGPEGETETRVGTTGVYVHADATLFTGANLLGATGDFPFYEVPGALPGTRFEVFPGSPSPTVTADGEIVVAFKGNYTEDGTAHTGAYYRIVRPDLLGGLDYVRKLADTHDVIPNQPAPPAGQAPVRFGSVAPPSADGEYAVFVGLDIEEAPTLGGIYRAAFTGPVGLELLVGLETKVPGTGQPFTRLGEGLAYDGRFVAFWGAWGDEWRTVRLYCPTEGNKDRLAWCTHAEGQGEGDPDSLYDEATGRWYQDKAVPVNQAVFLLDTATGLLTRVASTGEGLDDLLFWTYSGAVPGMGGGHGEGDAWPEAAADDEPSDRHSVRWRSSAYIAVTSNGAAARIAFKARSGERDADGAWIDPVDGLYLATRPGKAPMQRLLDTTMDGRLVDPALPEGLTLAEIGFEREGLRGPWLALSLKMAGEAEEDGFAGIYAIRIP